MKFLKVYVLVIFALFLPSITSAQYDNYVATTTLTLSICGNSLVDAGEDCDAPGETGVYSQTIVGRQCTASCQWGPYCGDGILQTQHTEECDDGNNDNGDFCSAVCKIEPAGSSGGSSGGNSGGGGGSSSYVGDTVININGKAYPSKTINFLLDTVSVGSVRSDNRGNFEFATEASPGTATLGIWALDESRNRSITLNNTFDVTQGAVTNLNGVILPPTISVASQNVNPGELINVSGQAVPDSVVELQVDSGSITERINSDSDGLWTYAFDTGRVSIAAHTLRARSIVGTPPLTTESSFGTSLQIFVGVDGQSSSPSDLNRDGTVNLIDFSILIFWWGTDGGNSDPSADINQNGRVSLEDFSILLFNWSG